MIQRDDILKKTAGMNPGSRIFFNFSDFCFSWSTFRTRFWPCVMCHVGVQGWKWKVLESWYAEAPKFWKSDQNWGSYGLDNQNHHYTSPFRSKSDQRWCLHWVFWKILIVMAITPSILVRFSKFWCLNPSVFQDLSFPFSDQPRGTCPRGQKRVLKLVHVN